MNTVKCAVKDCKEEFRTEESVTPNVRFICKNHPRSIPVNAAERKFDHESDTQDMDVRFQEVQFDPELGGSVSPLEGKRLGRRAIAARGPWTNEVGNSL